MKRKDYMKPTMRVVMLQHRHQILAGSIQSTSTNLSSEDDIDASWLKGKERIGICGATSTPRWLMQRVSDTVERLTQAKQH